MIQLFSEILRAVESLHLTDKHKVATPADWKVRSKNFIFKTTTFSR